VIKLSEYEEQIKALLSILERPVLVNPVGIDWDSREGVQRAIDALEKDDANTAMIELEKVVVFGATGFSVDQEAYQLALDVFKSVGGRWDLKSAQAELFGYNTAPPKKTPHKQNSQYEIDSAIGAVLAPIKTTITRMSGALDRMDESISEAEGHVAKRARLLGGRRR